MTVAIDILEPFADAETVLRKRLAKQLPATVAVVSATGPSITPPTVLARRMGGDCDRVTDFAVMLVSCFGTTRSESSSLAAQVQAIILNSINTAVALDNDTTALIDGAVVMVADHPENYDNPDLRQVVTTYELRMRRPRPTP